MSKLVSGTKFQLNDIVKHNKGGLYRIVDVPDKNKRLEHFNQPFYSYMNIDDSSIVWLRCQAEFEDGRFILHKAAG